ncbi:3-deoxy-D-manno-octulosonic acid transferase [Candidatus Neptunochlamydia vexilliferae]|uniref:3-deoxy-D-manno-octulosonic acid transferase n=1 Tax=Candidatus Neptunichlamydia vexilliferae TaxID=1651774 RepID=A0ABS0B138_9BACT|nr:3-deoxy-D-manno-octulosonic acid transferase [Candidatus Neptunochlamydia vexilliferae]MBF5060104.1 3-deoxy-D-manno-octulosonic acid transferase [Candidatus Neptunochlamydia vexilliferae]
MIRFFYDIAIFALLILFSPNFFFKGKYRKSLAARLKGKAPQGDKKLVIWLHAVSMGETKALSTLVPHIRRSHPDAFIFVTTVTETGQEEAKKIISEADAIHYLPFDFSWVINPFVKILKPDLLILVEGDYWLNLLIAVKKEGGKVVVANGKLSEKSLKRYLAFRSFSRPLFNTVDHFCLQGETYLERFLKLGIPPEKLTITGNLKFDIPAKQGKTLSLPLEEGDKVITLGSTHEGEETLLLKQLAPFLAKDPHLKVLVVPRHPERFKRVKSLINHPQVTVIDQMGVLPACYALSHLAIVGGSFVKGVGGHDVFEPAKMGVPSLFGPYMHTQVELDRALTQAGAGIKVDAAHLPAIVEKLLNDPKLHEEMGERGKAFAQKAVGAAFRTWNILSKNLL